MAASGIRAARGKKSGESQKEKPLRKARTRPRVESSEPKATTAKKKAEHRSVESTMGSLTPIGDGKIEVYVQLSELTPVAQYANVTVGPVAFRFNINDPGLDKLADVDWESEDPLSDEQQLVYDHLRGVLAAASNVISHHIDDDRELIEGSVAAHNKRKADESDKKQSGRRKKS